MALDDDTLRRLLAARTPGEWEMRPRMWEDEEYYVEVRGAPPGYLGCRYHNVGGTWEPVADAQLWAAAPALAAEVLRLRERAARADSDASGYLADHAAAPLDLGAATSRAEKAEGERDALRAAVREAFASGSAARAAADARFASPSAEAEAEWERALARGEVATERLRALVGEG